MRKVAVFEKVSKTQFDKDISDFSFSAKEIDLAYEKIILPYRATKGSAGYDFFLPFEIKLSPKESIKIPTGVRVQIDEGWMLAIYPRSGLGCRFRLQLDNTVGIIDSDYYFADNEGHIIIKITNDTYSNQNIMLGCGKAFVQGIFAEYGITYNDKTQVKRTGGFGSTS